MTSLFFVNILSDLRNIIYLCHIRNKHYRCPGPGGSMAPLLLKNVMLKKIGERKDRKIQTFYRIS